MYPPGRVIFIRPLKQLVGRRHRAGPRRLEKGWDAVWVTPKELIAEGILISGKVRAPAACMHACMHLICGLCDCGPPCTSHTQSPGVQARQS